MSRISEIFSSGAKVMVLETLAAQSEPIPLRHVASLSQTPVRSADLALKNLLKEKLVNRIRENRLTLYSLNAEHPMSGLLLRIFSLVKEFELNARAKRYDEKARSVLAFANEAAEMFKRTKSGRDGSSDPV